MNLDDIPAGSLCVVDTNVLLYAEQGASIQAQRFIRRCSSGEIKATLPQTVWQEFTHKLMLAEAMMRGLTSGGNPAKRLASRPEAIPVGRVNKLEESNTAEMLAFLAVRPVQTVVMSSFITDNGVESELNRGKFFAYRNADGKIEGIALIGHTTLVEASG